MNSYENKIDSVKNDSKSSDGSKLTDTVPGGDRPRFSRKERLRGYGVNLILIFARDGAGRFPQKSMRKAEAKTATNAVASGSFTGENCLRCLFPRLDARNALAIFCIGSKIFCNLSEHGRATSIKHG